MKLATLVAVFVGGAIWLGDVLAVRIPDHLADPWYWTGMGILVAGVAVGSFVRRHDPRVPRHLVDERGVTLGLRGLYALPKDEEDGHR
jgi:hypothetical protein